jgi:NCS1 family nucleobase:cation symporter-1
LGTWETASSILAVGLSWREAIPIVCLTWCGCERWISSWWNQIVVGTSSVAIPMVLNGAIGAKLHIPFSVAIRASFGYYFAYFAIV